MLFPSSTKDDSETERDSNDAKSDCISYPTGKFISRRIQERGDDSETESVVEDIFSTDTEEPVWICRT